MQPYSMEQTILEGKLELENLFDFVQNKAKLYDAYEMEVNIFAKIMSIGLIAMKCYFAEKGVGDLGSTIELEDGTVMRQDRQLRSRKYFSVFGKLDVPRYYYHAKGQKGIVPLDAEVNLPERCYSYLLQEWMNLCSVRDSFDESSVTLCSLLGLDISQSRFEVVSRECVNNYTEFYDKKELPAPETEGKLQIVQFDGKGVPMIKKEAAKIQARLGKGEKRQKTKEATVGVSYTVDRNIRTPEEVAKNLIFPAKVKNKQIEQQNSKISPQVRAKNIRRFASLELSRKEVMDAIVEDAKKRNSDKERPWVVVMDGALGLWVAVTLALSGIDWTGILDIIHVTEYLWKVGNILHGEQTAEAKKWVYDHLLSILHGRTGRVIGGLKQILTKREEQLSASQIKTIKKVIKYFENHKQWMRYDLYLKEGYPIGSGVVESTCGHTVKKRMEGTGRRWSIEGAESMLLLRSIYTSNDWKEYLQLHRKTERLKIYPHVDRKQEVYADDYCQKQVA